MQINKSLAAALLSAGMLTVSVVQAATTTVSRDFGGNDCSGYFGTGFDSCTIFINDAGEKIEISPVIAKYNGDLSLSETNATVFPTVDGNEFGFSGTTTDNKTGNWGYTQGAGDPYVRYWASKAGNNFKLFWTVDDTLAASGGVCDSGSTDIYNLTCLTAAQTVVSGSWSTPNDKSLSHITFYDSLDPVPAIPVPAAVWLFGSGLLGLVGIARRKKLA